MIPSIPAGYARVLGTTRQKIARLAVENKNGVEPPVVNVTSSAGDGKTDGAVDVEYVLPAGVLDGEVASLFLKLRKERPSLASLSPLVRIQLFLNWETGVYTVSMQAIRSRRQGEKS